MKQPPLPTYCYDWLTPENAIQHALAAFYAACRYADHDHRAYPDAPPMTRLQWTETFTEIFRLRIELQAGEAGAQIHEKTQEYLNGYIEPIWIVDNLSNRDTPTNIHCRAFIFRGQVVMSRFDQVEMSQSRSIQLVVDRMARMGHAAQRLGTTKERV